jgi:hypothetical protein
VPFGTKELHRIRCLWRMLETSIEPFRCLDTALPGPACLQLMSYHKDFQALDCNHDSRTQLRGYFGDAGGPFRWRSMSHIANVGYLVGDLKVLLLWTGTVRAQSGDASVPIWVVACRQLPLL